MSWMQGLRGGVYMEETICKDRGGAGMQDASTEDEAESTRERLLAFLRDPEPAWKDEDHPELVAMGTAAWVRAMRQEKRVRMRSIEDAPKETGA
jgi:hypothetical protein